MPSPFPGMNPYIEQDAYWRDSHLEFLPAIRERLVAQVRRKYIVLLDERIEVYDATSYADFIYAGRLDPPLSSRDAAWARRFLPATR
ncbi:MAG: DUF4058 family protein [Isosphaeraceae bacterium]